MHVAGGGGVPVGILKGDVDGVRGAADETGRRKEVLAQVVAVAGSGSSAMRRIAMRRIATAGAQ